LLPQQQQIIPPHGQQPPSHAVAAAAAAAGPRQTTDGLGLLIEAFDTHQTAAAPPPNGGAPPPPGTAYDPHSALQYYPQPPPALAMNDGYEHELGYYMSDGVGATMQQQSWAGGGDMYGY
jgi:hypothetical protein